MAENRPFTTFALRLTFLLLICPNGLINAERVVCSFSSSAANRMDEYSFEIADVPVSLCTHVVYDKLQIDAFTYELLPGNPHYDVLENGWEKFSDLKSIKPDLKLLISVRSPILLDVAENSTSRKVLVEQITQHVEWMKIDGVELFWGGDNEEVFYLLVEELKHSFAAAGHPTWEVSILMEINQAIVDRARLCKLADFVHVVGIGERSPRYRNNSSSPTAKTTIDFGDHKNVSLERALELFIDTTCPANKTVLVVIVFAQTYILEDHTIPMEHTSFCTLTQSDPYCAYVEICQKFSESEWTLGSDDSQGFAPYAMQNNTWVAYENEVSIGRKGEIARRKNLAGVYVYSLDLDDYRGKCGKLYPLTSALSRSFRGAAID